jgi:hypothetical protein
LLITLAFLLATHAGRACDACNVSMINKLVNAP